MFLSKLLSGRNSTKTKLELLAESWTNIQKYYESAADPLKDAVDLTPIPGSLQNMVKLIQAEEIEYQRPSGSLETGPCLEYLLQKRVLEELVEFAKVDTPYGMRIHCLQFFCSLITNVHAQLLPERAVHVPLQKLITSCHRLITHHYEQITTEAEICSEERISAISELSLELVKLMHGIFSHFKGTNAFLMDLFFERGWCRSLGENVWKSSKDGKTLHKTREIVEEKMKWNMFLTPRFDIFTYLIDYMNMPGETGEIAREAILFALRLLEKDPEYVCYVVEYSGLCEVMAERLSLLFASLPKNKGTYSITNHHRIIPTRPARQSIQFSVPAIITNNSLVITVNAQNSFKKKRRKRSPFDANFVRSLEYMKDSDQIVDEFYSFWEYLNDVSRVAEKRLMIALMAQLTAIFWHPIVCTGLSSPCADMAASVTAYTTEMIRSLTDQRLLRVFLVVLIGEEGGAGKDVEPERKVDHIILDLIDDEHDGESTHTGDNGTDTTNRSQMTLSTENEYDMDMTLRLLLINRMDSECHDLALATLRLFDTIIDTYNQFAIYNLVLRNYLDISPNGEHITDIPRRRSSVNEGLHSLSLDSEKSNDTESEKSLEDPPEGKKLATNADEKTQKVQWLIERVLSLLPLEDQLKKIESPPWSGVIQFDSVNYQGDDSYPKNSHGDMLHPMGESVPFKNESTLPGNSYDDYFHEAQERFNYALISTNFWKSPYPEVKSKKGFEKESTERKTRNARPKSMPLNPSMFLNSQGLNADREKTTKVEAYEGLFLSRLFDQFDRMLELPLEQNLLITSILQKIVGVVDKRMDNVICDWRAVRIGNDGTLYGGVWALPSTKGNRRSLYALLEQITFEALKRAQLVPNFETRISLAKKRGMESDSITSQANGSQPDKPQRRATLANIHTTSTTTKQVNEKGWPKADTLGTVNTSSDPSVNRRPSLPVLTRSAGLSLHVPKELSIPEELSPSIVSPLTSFFQATQRSTPVTMTNPFAKLSDFVNSYIVLQEFCKELAAVILVRHMTHHNEIGYLRALEQREQIDNIGSPDASTNHDWFIDHRLLDDENAAYRKKKMEKWKNRFSAVSTLAEWKSIQGSDMMDEAIAARIKSKAGGMAAALT